MRIKRRQKPPRAKKGVKVYLCKDELKALPSRSDHARYARSSKDLLQEEINRRLGDGHKQHVQYLTGDDKGRGSAMEMRIKQLEQR